VDYSARSKNRAISPKEHSIIENETAVMAGATDVAAIQLDCQESNKEEDLEDDDGLLCMEALGQVEDDDLSFYDDDDAAESSQGLF
jgi:hypothetical protein